MVDKTVYRWVGDGLMTVQDLKDALALCDPNMPVYIGVDEAASSADEVLIVGGHVEIWAS